MGDTEGAERAYRQALKLTERLLAGSLTKEEQKRREAIVATGYTALGKLYGQLGEYETAKAYFEKALSLANDDSRFIDVFLGLGQLFIDHGYHKSAIGPLKQGLALADAKGVTEKQAEIAGLLADCFEDDPDHHYLYLRIYRKLTRKGGGVHAKNRNGSPSAHLPDGEQSDSAAETAQFHPTS